MFEHKKRVLINIDIETYLNDETLMREISAIQYKYPASMKINEIRITERKGD